MARDLARVSAMDGMMWLGFVHCRRSFLQQRGLSAKIFDNVGTGARVLSASCFSAARRWRRGGRATCRRSPSRRKSGRWPEMPSR